jgi:hypothetical protein
MENASKALIIAGAILLSILIIGLGMTVYNNASSATGSANLDAQEISAHNSQFLAYEGRQKGTQVKALISAIKANNKTYQDRIITIGVSASTTKATVTAVNSNSLTANTTDPNQNSYSTWTSSTIKSNTTYYVTFGYGDNSCINTCEIHVYSDNDLK